VNDRECIEDKLPVKAFDAKDTPFSNMSSQSLCRLCQLDQCNEQFGNDQCKSVLFAKVSKDDVQFTSLQLGGIEKEGERLHIS
jgi:hypothetical protein